MAAAAQPFAAGATALTGRGLSSNVMRQGEVVHSREISLEQLKECLERSGYLFESRLVRSLSDLGFFVEPNQTLVDARTGKSREIDLVAEYFEHNPHRIGVLAKTTFVVEAYNNSMPFVLTTERPSSPNSNWEQYIKYVSTPHDHDFPSNLDVYGLPEADVGGLFSQYCVISRKKENKELMASHPDDVYGSLLKLSEYVESDMQKFYDPSFLSDTKFWRLFFWHPVLVLGGKLVCASVSGKGSVDLVEKNYGRLEFNWHAGEEQKTTVIEVVTEQYFTARLREVVYRDKKLEAEMQRMRNESAS